MTTVAWLTATLVTKPEPPDVLARFKALVRADGRDAGKGVLYTFLFSLAIFASMGEAACSCIKSPLRGFKLREPLGEGDGRAHVYGMSFRIPEIVRRSIKAAK